MALARDTDTLQALLRSELSGARVCSEVELQVWIARVLSAHGIAHVREATLGDAGRPDFLIGRVAVEVKVGGSRAALLRQVQRYASHPDVAEVLVVTTRLGHTLPATLAGKRVAGLYVTALGVV